MRKINKIIIHCTASQVTSKWYMIHNYHVNILHWSDCGYHYIIEHNGEVVACRPLEEVGAHCLGHNDDSIGIALVGGKYSFDFSYEQLRSLVGLLKTLCVKYNIVKSSIYGHNEFNKVKACPRFSVKNLLLYENI